jgi:hypothetical protein
MNGLLPPPLVFRDRIGQLKTFAACITEIFVNGHTPPAMKNDTTPHRWVLDRSNACRPGNVSETVTVALLVYPYRLAARTFI